MRKKLLLLTALLAGASGVAQEMFYYDWYDEYRIYFRVIGEDEVEVISPTDYDSSLDPYSGKFGIDWDPTVTHDGVTYRITTIGERAFMNAQTQGWNASSQNFSFDGVITTIKADAFNGWKNNIVSVSGATNIDPTAFRNNKINRINCSGGGFGNSVENVGGWDRPGGEVYKTVDGKRVLFVWSGDRRESAYVNESGYNTVTTSWTFNYDEIGDYAMYGNDKLQTVVITGATKIGTEAMKNMTALTSLTLPAELTEVGADAFAGTTGLSTIVCNATTPPAGAVFEDEVYARIRQSGNITVPSEALAAYQADENWSKFWVTEDTPKYFITGDVTGGKQQLADNGTSTYKITVELEAGASFAFCDGNDAVYGAPDGGATVTLDTPMAVVADGASFTLENAGKWDIAFDVETMTVTVSEYVVRLEDAFQYDQLWYKPVSDTEVEITPIPNGSSYNVTLDDAWGLTSTVTSPNTGNEYTVVGIGENAFKNGFMGSDPGYYTTFDYFGFPSTITYIRAHAFDGASMNYPGIDFAAITELDETAFVNNRINWFNTSRGGDLYKIRYVDANSGKNNCTYGGELYKEVDGVKTLLVYPGGRRNNSWKNGANYNRITTNAELDYYDVIGVNAFYGNTNITSVELGSAITAIEENAFKNVTTLRTIYIGAAEPPSVATDFEQAVYDDGQLVLQGDAAANERAYRQHPVWGKFFEPEAIELTGVTFSEGHNYATWYGEDDLAVPAGLTAYVVSAVSGDEATITAVDYIPANTGVLLYSDTEASNLTAEVYDGTADEVTSLLVGYNEDTAITDGYLLWGDAFYRALAGTLPAHRCYLPMPEDEPSPVSRVRLVQAGNSVVTGIADVNAARTGRVTYVSVTGQTSDRPFSGVNIVIAPDGTVSKIMR